MRNTEQQWYRKASAELKSRGYGNVSRAIMEQWLYSGHCSQDDYDLYIDLWVADQSKMSVSSSAAAYAADRLMAKFSLG